MAAVLAVKELFDRLNVSPLITTEPWLAVDLSTVPPAAVDEAAMTLLAERTQVIIGVLPEAPTEAAVSLARACTVTLSAQPLAERQIVAVHDITTALRALTTAVHASPVAAISLSRLLRLQSRLPVRDALVAESALYSVLLAGGEFTSWLESRRGRRPQETADPVEVKLETRTLRITLSRPARRNAFNAAMREALCDALAVAAGDPSLRVELRGGGPDFCAGGDLDEFGTSLDPASAHLLRTARSAGLALHRVADRTTAYLQGNCIGAGIELPAFAGRVVARPDVRIRLPELSMGLIPGAGGTVSLTRRIGPWRTAWLALTGATLTASEALGWGLVDEVRP
ncbi:enoyl-CoA hydratase/isomerase family protein [Planobispora longispora]|uniref:Enoyl-CoA hydratase n=1 Tax=Planobispora longispora TaxID=28887 RepID=A0A8J3RF54_9ACTN|nr:enoyl-CoA hydratase/isomerase family protein [Planobispora longispora]GIH73575.1 enoyl-CoA hydratase [Planobispora longispora]